MMIAVLSRAGIGFMRLLGRLPLPWVRALGWLLGWALYAVAISRRKVVLTNLRLCFAAWSASQRQQVARQHFVVFAQAWLDRGWLWHGSEGALQSRLTLSGDVGELLADAPVVLFAPHFVGLDAGWTALNQQLTRRFSTIYSHQTNRQVDEWMQQGRQRFGAPQLFDRFAGPKAVVSGLRSGDALYLLPDMNYGLQESVFVPFFGVPAATVTSLARFAKLGRAKVVPVLTRMTPTGYEVRVMPAWVDVPSADVVLDTALMNQRLEGFIETMPEQYYWVHKRFKDQPEGAPPIY